MLLPPSKLPEVGTTIFSVMTALAQHHGAINLAQGFPDYDVAEGLQDLVTNAIRSGLNQYAPMLGLPVLREAVGSTYKVNPETDVTITPGGTAALTTAILAFVSTGDEVIIFEPAYDSYAPAVLLAGGRVCPVPLLPPNYQPDWSAFARVLSSRTRLVIINSPHNPTGSVWSRTDIDTLAGYLDGTSTLVLSDEVYESITFDGTEHVSVRHVPALNQRSLSVLSFGKMFHVTGWKVGACIAPQKLTEEFRKAHQFVSFSVHTPTQAALATWMTSTSLLAELSEFFQKKRDLFRSALEGSPFTIRQCRGSYFQLLGTERVRRQNESDRMLAERLTIENGVASIPLSPFTSLPGMSDDALRFCFAKKDETLLAAAERLHRVPAV
ncbi:MAG TPA: aminotransferase [Bacteroidetes bacterium]|nr:aminotransferase [Bacteroidota bacterium]HRK04866.1 methionine aminotransferase [Chlorobiota bacterium]